VDFKNTVLIMTSNIGSRDIKATGAIGFSPGSEKDRYQAMKGNIEDALKRVFNPEFLNRVDDAIIFHSLEREHIHKIIDIAAKDLFSRMTAMGINIEIAKAAKEFLADKGFDPAFGARPLRRAVQKYVEDPLAEEILKGTFQAGTRVRVRLNKKKDALSFSGSKKKAGDDAPAEEGEEVMDSQ